MVRVVDCHAGVLGLNPGGPKDFPLGITTSQRGVQANHMNPLSIRHCRSLSCIINKEISLNKYVDFISFFSYGAALWDPYGTHLGNLHMG